MRPGQLYDVEYAPSPDGPWTTEIAGGSVDIWGFTEIEISDAKVAWYRVVEN